MVKEFTCLRCGFCTHKHDRMEWHIRYEHRVTSSKWFSLMEVKVL